MLELNDNIFYVGVNDTRNGAYNNAYLVKGEKTALIDTVSDELSQVYIENIEEIMPVKDIDYLVCNHSELDKSGAVKHILELNPDIEVVGTIAAIKNLKEITNMSFNEHIAKNGAVIDLGRGKSLEFCITPNLNWPDTMVTYESDSKTLFSCDIFSAYCEGDECKTAIKEYYNLKLSPYADFVKTAIKKISAFDIECICPGYGPVIKSNIHEVMDCYAKWSKDRDNSKTAAVFYVSRYGYTKKMADVVYETLKECGIVAKCFNIEENDSAKMIAAMNLADAVIFGTPTINRNAVKSVWDIISSMDMVNMKGKTCFVFGSYGWGGEGIYNIHNLLEALKLKPFDKPFGCILNPSEAKLEELEKYTQKFVEYMKK